jgi:hypothetical protein
MPDAPVLEPPAAPPSPPPAAAPEAPATPPPKGHEEAFGALDALGREDGTPEPPTITPGDGRVRGPDGKFAKVTDKPAEKVVEKPKPQEPAKDEDDVDKLPTREVVKLYHAIKNEKSQWLKEREEFEKKLKTPTEWPEKKTYEEKLAEREKAIEEHKKRVADYEQELQFTNFTKSQAYKDQYEKPLTQAYKAGAAKTAMLQIVERKDGEENVVQAARDATPADFDVIMRITDERTAIKKSVEMFGDGAAVVLQHRENVFEKNRLAEEAIAEYRTKGAEREKTLREQSEKQSKEFTGMIDNFQKAAVEKYPTLFKPDESDPKGNELLEKGSHLLQRVLKNGAPVKDGETQMTGEEYAIAVAAVRNKAAAFDRVAYKASALTKRVKELEKELEQFKASKPGSGNGSGRAAAPPEDDPLALIDKLGRER